MLHVDKKFEKFEEITPDILKKANVKLLLCDYDNTIRLHSEKQPSKELINWAKACKDAGIKIVIVSNNGRKKAMKKFCDPIGVSYVWWAMKPSPRSLKKVMVEQGFSPEETIMVGDKWSTDVLAANLAKVRAWKVNHRRNVA